MSFKHNTNFFCMIWHIWWGMAVCAGGHGWGHQLR